MLDVKISCFQNYFSTEPRPVTLGAWLNSDKYAETVAAIRAASTKDERDALKAKLPAITPSGLFSGKRESAALIKHSGFVQIDIDFQDNKHIANFAELKEQLCKLTEIAYLGLSVSGTGFWGLIPIAYPSQHKEHFDALLDDFSALGIKLDSKPRNVASLRGYSYDPDAYLNPDAKQYRKVKQRTPERYKAPSSSPRMSATDETEQNVLTCLAGIERAAVDVTGDYGQWFAIGCALAAEFGEAGRAYFHRASQYHPKYRAADTDRQFDHCLKRPYSFSIGTFFTHCKNAGISYAELKPRSAPQPPQAAAAPPQPRQGLPPGFAITGGTIEFEGLPIGWLNDSELEDAKKQAQGHELAIFEQLNPATAALVERFELTTDLLTAG